MKNLYLIKDFIFLILCGFFNSLAEYYGFLHTYSINKFEVSKIYMTACICLYKFCPIKEYFLMIFSCFIQKIEWYFYDSSCFFMFYSRSWIMFYYILLKNIHVLMNFSWFFMFDSKSWIMFYYILLPNIYVLSMILINFSQVISPLNHDLIWFYSAQTCFSIAYLKFIQVFHVLFKLFRCYSSFIQVFHVRLTPTTQRRI